MINIDEIELLRQDLDYYFQYSDDFSVWKKEHKKWEYYKAKLLIFQVELTKARNFYLGVLS